jgi:hypothetical protein
MERERQFPEPHKPGPGGGAEPERCELDRMKAEGDGLLDAADKILHSLRPVEAEAYLEQSHQQGGQ